MRYSYSITLSQSSWENRKKTDKSSFFGFLGPAQLHHFLFFCTSIRVDVFSRLQSWSNRPSMHWKRRANGNRPCFLDWSPSLKKRIFQLEDHSFSNVWKMKCGTSFFCKLCLWLETFSTFAASDQILTSRSQTIAALFCVPWRCFGGCFWPLWPFLDMPRKTRLVWTCCSISFNWRRKTPWTSMDGRHQVLHQIQVLRWTRMCWLTSYGKEPPCRSLGKQLSINLVLIYFGSLWCFFLRCFSSKFCYFQSNLRVKDGATGAGVTISATSAESSWSKAGNWAGAISSAQGFAQNIQSCYNSNCNAQQQNQLASSFLGLASQVQTWSFFFFNPLRHAELFVTQSYIIPEYARFMFLPTGWFPYVELQCFLLLLFWPLALTAFCDMSWGGVGGVGWGGVGIMTNVPFAPLLDLSVIFHAPLLDLSAICHATLHDLVLCLMLRYLIFL